MGELVIGAFLIARERIESIFQILWAFNEHEVYGKEKTNTEILSFVSGDKFEAVKGVLNRLVFASHQLNCKNSQGPIILLLCFRRFGHVVAVACLQGRRVEQFDLS